AVERTYYAAAAWLDRDPLVLPNGLLFNGNDLRLDTFSLLYDDRGFPALAQLWQALTQAPAGVAGVDVLRTTRAAGIPTAQIPADNGKAAQFAVLCNDAAWPRSVATYSHNVAADRQLFPGTAGFPANIWPCAFWPDRPIEAPVRVTDRGPHDVLILQNLRDPATPWISGFGLRETLGPRATMVSVDQGGHGVFPITQAPCATAIATDFLASGALPAQD